VSSGFSQHSSKKKIIIRCLGALLMKAYLNDLCGLFLRVEKKKHHPLRRRGG